MSHRLISRNQDLKRLRDEGYDVEVRAGYLLIKSVPYVTADRRVQRGVLASTLDLAGDTTIRPGSHVAMFSEAPRRADGSLMTDIIASSRVAPIDSALVMTHDLSSKPRAGYADYYEKMTTYVRIISHAAQAIEPQATAIVSPVIADHEGESAFEYVDTASSRADINAITARLASEVIAIVGLGGTGSYVLDLVAKTPVKEIHLFDADHFLQHNAFRAPGAPSIEDLRSKPTKVDYLQRIYSRMHRRIVAHAYRLDSSNASELARMTFTFLCLDNPAAKPPLIDTLSEIGISFIDVGMGLYVADGQVHGTVRTTSSTASMRAHITSTVSFSEAPEFNDDYRTNVQIADLNALNAALAVIKWKKLAGFYGDLDREHSSLYVVNGNQLINEDKAG